MSPNVNFSVRVERIGPQGMDCACMGFLLTEWPQLRPWLSPKTRKHDRARQDTKANMPLHRPLRMSPAHNCPVRRELTG